MHFTLARHGRGIYAVGHAYLAKVHPIFMLPPLAAAIFGWLLAQQIDAVIGAVHLIAVFSAVYTAHLKDGYVDYYLRQEDTDTVLTETGFRLGLVVSSLVFALSAVALALLVDIWAALITVPGWCIGYFHAPQLDMSPIGSTLGYPIGIVLAFLGGMYVQMQAFEWIAVGLAGVFLLVLTGIKVIDDLQDYAWDRKTNKRTASVVLGPRRAWRGAYGLMLAAMLLIVVLAIIQLFPPSSVIAAVIFFVLMAIAARADPEIATMLLIRGSYLLLALLIVATWWEPLA